MMITNPLLSCTVGANMTYTKVLTLSVYLVEIRTSRKEIVSQGNYLIEKSKTFIFIQFKQNKIKSKLQNLHSKSTCIAFMTPGKEGLYQTGGSCRGFRSAPILPYHMESSVLI